ncbi:hypothetical protein JKP88DRAFT_294321 [Tribonema minus]|uniref:Uncharacterized protein n=1 Tax=Tribonema minus TaxID=303371 RepID=A0A836CNN0_9STRA|nr:hypothetical protein JKP88DRAFT_294321 [Tribonema minus]
MRTCAECCMDQQQVCGASDSSGRVHSRGEGAGTSPRRQRRSLNAATALSPLPLAVPPPWSMAAGSVMVGPAFGACSSASLGSAAASGQRPQLAYRRPRSPTISAPSTAAYVNLPCCQQPSQEAPQQQQQCTGPDYKALYEAALADSTTMRLRLSYITSEVRRLLAGDVDESRVSELRAACDRACGDTPPWSGDSGALGMDLDSSDDDSVSDGRSEYGEESFMGEANEAPAETEDDGGATDTSWASDGMHPNKP